MKELIKLLVVVMVCSLALVLVYSHAARNRDLSETNSVYAAARGAVTGALPPPVAEPTVLNIRFTASQGESAPGQKMPESTSSKVIINLKPCDKKGDYMSFNAPYEEEDAGETMCGEQKVKLIVVTKK